jgi:transcription termination factor NusB
VYSRVNRYVLVLNKQEMRRSDFPGNFLNLAEKLAINSFFDKAKIFTITNRRRFGDAEYASELLAGLIGGIQDKKNTLDNFYKDYADWNITEKDKIEREFLFSILCPNLFNLLIAKNKA